MTRTQRDWSDHATRLSARLPLARDTWVVDSLVQRQQHLAQFAGWCGLGLLAFGVELALLALLHQQLRCPLWLASALAAECVLVGRFLTTDRFVFGYRRPSLARCGRFHASAAGAFAISWVALNGSAMLLGLPYVAAAFVGTVAAFGWSALSNFLWVWRQPN